MSTKHTFQEAIANTGTWRYCVGGLSHQSACKVAYFRGQYSAMLASSNKYHGAMISVALSEYQILPYMEQLKVHFGRIGAVIACVNSPVNVTVSGDEDHIALLKSLLDKDSIFARKLQVNVAYHSPHMLEIAKGYRESLDGLKSREAYNDHSTMISSVTGLEVSHADLRQGEYWEKNLTLPVRFLEAMTQICNPATTNLKKILGTTHSTVLASDLLEIGPHSALNGPVKDILQKLGADISYSSALVRSLPSTDTVLSALGHLHCYGYPVDLSKVNALDNKHMILSNLPEYPFDHSRSYWQESRVNRDGWRLRTNLRLDLLGAPVPDWNPMEAKWRNYLRVSEVPWIRDHCVGYFISPIKVVR